jgi:hypothetical protein
VSQTYPPTGRFYTLTPIEKAERLDTAEDVLANADWWRGDPRLNWWQEGFLTNLAARLRISDGRYKISVKEWDKYREIQNLMMRAPPDPDSLADEPPD